MQGRARHRSASLAYLSRSSLISPSFRCSSSLAVVYREEMLAVRVDARSDSWPFCMAQGVGGNGLGGGAQE